MLVFVKVTLSILTVLLVCVTVVFVFSLFQIGAIVEAEGKTSSNCEIYATVEGVDRYACDDFARGYTCYDRAQGMTFCVEMTEEYK